MVERLVVWWQGVVRRAGTNFFVRVVLQIIVGILGIALMIAAAFLLAVVFDSLEWGLRGLGLGLSTAIFLFVVWAVLWLVCLALLATTFAGWLGPPVSGAKQQMRAGVVSIIILCFYVSWLLERRASEIDNLCSVALGGAEELRASATELEDLRVAVSELADIPAASEALKELQTSIEDVDEPDWYSRIARSLERRAEPLCY
jgi:hypothetical protein